MNVTLRTRTEKNCRADRRATAKQLISRTVYTRGLTYPEAWRECYDKFSKHIQVDLRAEKQDRKMSIMDVIEARGLMREFIKCIREEL
jgi:hypothetical protein